MIYRFQKHFVTPESSIIRLKKYFLTFVLLSLISNVLADEDDEKFSNALILTKTQQVTLGIETIKLEAYQYAKEQLVYGIALSPQPLLELNNRYQIAQQNRLQALAQLTLVQQSLTRGKKLFDQGIAAKKNIQELKSQIETQQSLAAIADLQITTVRNESLLTWGNKLTDLILKPDKINDFAPYISGEAVLILIRLPQNSFFSQDSKMILISSSGNRDEAVPARFISKSPTTDPVLQGENYFFSAKTQTIKPGMRITGWVPQQIEKQSGVLIPATAIVWHLGQAYVYVNSEKDTFSRIRLSDYTKTDQGYFVKDSLEPGDQLVSMGAQILLSEEYRSQIPDEDDED